MPTNNDPFPVHPRRTVDATRWFPFAWVHESGIVTSKDLPVREFTIAVYVRNAIMRAMRQ